MVNHLMRPDFEATVCGDYVGETARHVSVDHWDIASCPECQDGATPEPGNSDPINSPAHYTWLGGIEVIDITEHLGFCLGNVVKYVCRADHKGKPIEDLEKAQWYLAREIARRKR
jgi:hypothetical protein